MRYCAKCGKKLIEPDEKFCPECGAALPNETPPAEEPAKAVKGKGEQTARKSKLGFGIVFLVVVVFIFICVAVLIMIALTGVSFLFLEGGNYTNGGGSVLVSDPCANVTCHNHCFSNTRYYNGICKAGTCNYNTMLCSVGCSNGSCLSPTVTLLQVNYSVSTTRPQDQADYAAFCDKIDPYDLSVREAAAEATKGHPGSYSTAQLFDVYDWVNANIEYHNVAFAGIPYPANETLATKEGDCKNHAVLVTSMVRSIGGKAYAVVDAACEHAYSIVYVGPSKKDMDSFSQQVAAHYRYKAFQINYLNYNNSMWAIIDTTGGFYPGDVLPGCVVKMMTIDIESSCLDCVNEDPSYPYTFNGLCYNGCPSGAIALNKYACACPTGTQFSGNRCR